MSLPYPILLILFAPFLISIILLFKSLNRAKKLKTQLDNSAKYNLYKENLIKELQNGIEYGKNLESVINIISNNLDRTFPYSSLSSIFIKGQKLVFNTKIKESVNHAFIEHIKDTMLESLSNAINTNKEIEESITGLPLDDVSTSQIMSSFDLKLVVKGNNVAIINLSSTKPNLYNGTDIKSLSSVSEIISGLLTNIESQLDIEKSKSLSMIDSFSEGIFMIDRNQNLVAMNNSAMSFLNIHKQTPTINDVLSALPNTYNFKDKIAQVIAQNKQTIEEDVPLNTKSFKIIITPVVVANNPEKTVIGASVLLHDTTLEKSLAHLKDDFTNIMVHELRSPLTAIKASSEFLQSNADLSVDEKQQLTRMISESSKKMLDEIALILDSAKMDAGLFTIRKTPSDLKKLLIDRVAVFEPIAAEKTIKLVVDIDPLLPTFAFDPIRIDEVVNNLLSNSLKFTPANGTIDIKAHSEAGKVSVSVADTGAGIPKDKQHLLFSKFQQAPTDGEHVGTGLGLYVVKGVIEAHGGSVKLESEEGKGTTITLTLPLTSLQQSYPAAAKSPNPMSN